MLTYNKLKDIQNIDLPTGRVYDLPHAQYPSITTILSATSNKMWLQKWIEKVGEEEANRIKNEAANRGTIMHQYLEDLYTLYDSPTKDQVKEYLNTCGLAAEKPFIRVMVVEILKHLLANNFISKAQEIVVWDDDLKIAGRCDAIGYLNNKLYVIDYKSSRKKKRVQDIKDYYLQATFYTLAHNKLFPDSKINNFAILIASEDGVSQVFTGNPQNYIPELKYRVKLFYEQKTS